MSVQDRYNIPDYLKEKMMLDTHMRKGGCESKNCDRPPFPRYPYHPCEMGGFCGPVAVPYRERMQPPHPRRRQHFHESGMTQPGPVPFYQTYPDSLYMQQDLEEDMDLERIRDMYPQNAKRIQMLVDEQADKMEQDGSIMFDQYPDKMMIERIVNDIYMAFMRMYMKRQSDDKDKLEDMFEGDCNNCDLDEDTIKDLIAVLLFQEMFRRRCRNRQCNRWW